MKKNTIPWTIDRLRKEAIKFPEYQREPTIWGRKAKQRLIDSIVRGFDIGSIYLYDNGDGTFDCIDGRQRISAIGSFFGDESEEHAGFPYEIMNEVYNDNGDNDSKLLSGKRFSDIKDLASSGDSIATNFVDIINGYELTIVILSDSAKGDEFNLQFTRLNLGVIINSGEKLNAMIGDIRNVCFDQLAETRFLASVNIPTRRYAQAQLAAQIMA